MTLPWPAGWQAHFSTLQLQQDLPETRECVLLNGAGIGRERIVRVRIFDNHLLLDMWTRPNGRTDGRTIAHDFTGILEQLEHSLLLLLPSRYAPFQGLTRENGRSTD